MIVTVDGPSAAGKGTLARRLAGAFGFAHLDTGALYRATALRLIRNGADMQDVRAAVAAAQTITPEDLNDPALRDEAVGEGASVVAPFAEVRAALLDYQRNFAAHPPGGAVGAVLDGRDTGTVVCPNADVKLFVTASLEARVDRRYAELKARGEDVDRSVIEADIVRRDRRDSDRAAAPLKPADDAHLLDTTNLDIEAAFRAAKRIVAEAR